VGKFPYCFHIACADFVGRLAFVGRNTQGVILMRPFSLLMRGAAAAAMSFGVLSAAAQPPAGGGQHKPPAEAIAACKAAAAGSDCNFTDSRGAHKGTCWAPEGKPLACKPKAAGDAASHPKPPSK
jgi:hypothetical protein